jgi:hypothetical protein
VTVQRQTEKNTKKTAENTEKLVASFDNFTGQTPQIFSLSGAV